MVGVTAGQPAAEKVEVIRGLCEKSLHEGADIWEALEAKGIYATPGVIYQAMGGSGKPAHEAAGEGPGEVTGTGGLTADDLEALTRIARKAGGVEGLLRVLVGMRQMLDPEGVPLARRCVV
jgi:hypothetical protein